MFINSIPQNNCTLHVKIYKYSHCLGRKEELYQVLFGHDIFCLCSNHKTLYNLYLKLYTYFANLEYKMIKLIKVKESIF